MMIENAGQRYWIGEYENALLLRLARAEIRNMEEKRFDRYDSPFEAKLTMRDKTPRTFGNFSSNAWSQIMEDLEGNAWCERISEMFGVEVVADRWRHYAGVFRYLPDDHLGVHVDAAIHPISGLRKHVTLVLYFGAGAGDLELWQGSSCVEDEPILTQIIDSVAPTFGRIVAFECNDYAWHGTAANESDADRIVLTVSYLSAATAPHADMQNQRSRAFFIPRPYEEWEPETYRLRDRRADPERYAEAYRAG